MLNRNYLKELLENKEYIKISKHFEEEYFCILRDFCLKKDITINNNDDLNHLMIKVNGAYSKYRGLISILSKSLNNEEYKIDERLNALIDNYNIIKERLT